jgi:hypothetical protein
VWFEVNQLALFDEEDMEKDLDPDEEVKKKTVFQNKTKRERKKYLSSSLTKTRVKNFFKLQEPDVVFLS